MMKCVLGVTRFIKCRASLVGVDRVCTMDGDGYVIVESTEKFNSLVMLTMMVGIEFESLAVDGLTDSKS